MKENKAKIWLKKEKPSINFFQGEDKYIHALCWKFTLICIGVSYYHSSKSISGSKNLMYTTISSRKFKEKVYNRKQ